MEEVEQTEKKPSDHRIALQNFDGTTTIVEADEIRFCVPTGPCIKFWATIVACFIAMGLGVFFMVWGGPDSVYFKVGSVLLGAGVGILIPGPDFSSMTKGFSPAAA